MHFLAWFGAGGIQSSIASLTMTSAVLDFFFFDIYHRGHPQNSVVDLTGNAFFKNVDSAE